VGRDAAVVILRSRAFCPPQASLRQNTVESHSPRLAKNVVHGFAFRERPAALGWNVTDEAGRKIMDFLSRLDGLQQHVANAKNGVQAAATENRDQLRQRIDQAQVDGNRAAEDAQRSDKAPTSAKNKWKQMRADAADKMSEVKARIDTRNRQIDADAAATDADLAEADATDAIDYAAWTVDNARLAILDAIDARAYANMRASTAAS
jgi:hypothetical protein